MRSRSWVGRALAAVLALVVLVCLGAGLYVAFMGYDMYRQALEASPLEQTLAAVRGQEGFTPLEELPQLYLDAVVAVEDHRFYDHGGIDAAAIARALWNDLCAGSFVEGGSTITQQLAKNLWFTQEKVLIRKAAEMFMAFAIERVCTKDEILELYVNSIYFGNGCTGVGQASRVYLGKEASGMTPRECTLLAGVPNAPSAYDPLNSPALAEKRREKVVERLAVCGYVSTEEARALLAQGRGQ